MVTFAFCDNAPVFASLGTIRGTLSAISPTIKAYDEDLDKEEAFHALSLKRVISSMGSCGTGEHDPENEALYRQLYNMWHRKLGDVCLPPYRKSHNFLAVSDAFDWVNYKKLLEREPSLIKWSLRKPREEGSLRDTNLEALLMRHPFTIFPSKILTGRKVAIYNDSFQEGYCVVPASSQPGDILCYLRDPLSPLVVLRPVSDSQCPDMNRIITGNWKENPPVWFGNKGLKSEGLDPRHFTYIGEAWIQRSSFPIMRAERAHFLYKLIVIH